VVTGSADSSSPRTLCSASATGPSAADSRADSSAPGDATKVTPRVEGQTASPSIDRSPARRTAPVPQATTSPACVASSTVPAAAEPVSTAAIPTASTRPPALIFGTASGLR